VTLYYHCECYIKLTKLVTDQSCALRLIHSSVFISWWESLTVIVKAFDPKMHKRKRNLSTSVGPKVTMRRGVIWPRDSLLPGGRGREERGRGLNTPQWDSAWSDWLGSYGSCWLEVGAEGGFKLDLRQDRDSGKRKLKGAVRTETYRRHYCQHSSLFCLLKKGGVVFALASLSWQGAA
jgi:hypothetical protein